MPKGRKITAKPKSKKKKKRGEGLVALAAGHGEIYAVDKSPQPKAGRPPAKSK